MHRASVYDLPMNLIYVADPMCSWCYGKHVWRYFKAVQHAFYAEGRNVVRTDVLARLAEQQGLPRPEFEAAFESTQMREATHADFEESQAWGIRGFPTLLAQSGDRLQLVTRGYVPIETLRERLAAALAAHP